MIKSLEEAKATALLVFDSYEPVRGTEDAIVVAAAVADLPAATVRRAVWLRAVAERNAGRIAARADLGGSYLVGLGIRKN